MGAAGGLRHVMCSNNVKLPYTFGRVWCGPVLEVKTVVLHDPAQHIVESRRDLGLLGGHLGGLGTLGAYRVSQSIS